MWQTKRLGKPIVLLALTWALAAEAGCTAKPAHTAEPPGTEPIPSGSMTGAPGGAGDTVAIVGGDAHHAPAAAGRAAEFVRRANGADDDASRGRPEGSAIRGHLD
ncbi:hypothetical protein OMP38_34290 [Cohnella ginsengisoli]|uniref:Uncharacterized protein n=1 Tax=Cohnella ginsengisoli TaxID=425004 RepID=A0A9X4KSL6_9BACL|nr:hypothetical protein [Cohnella ginsengisoli]MDG0795332.1 hypothetical protein [Cohnella ginsengisoli]